MPLTIAVLDLEVKKVHSVPHAERAAVTAGSNMVELATTTAGDDRLSFALATAEQLPYPDDRLDLVGRRGKARTKQRCNRLLRGAGFGSLSWHQPYAIIINAVTGDSRAGAHRMLFELVGWVLGIGSGTSAPQPPTADW